MESKDWMTRAIAICALLLSAYNAYNIYLQRRDKKPRLRLRARLDHNYDFFVKQNDDGGATMEKDTAVVVKVENIGERE